MPNLMETMRQIAANERQAALPMTICFGKVIALSPFRVQIDQKLVLTKEFFIVKSWRERHHRSRWAMCSS